MRIAWIICFLHLVNLTKGQDSTNTLRCKRSSSMISMCQTGCATCSALNGCLSCKPRLFFHLEHDGIQQRGTCVSSCPRGHYGVRSPHINTCTRCKSDCASCFSENFCTHCHPGHFLFRGRCYATCPKGLMPNPALRECTECPAGCELCAKRNTCVRCREDMFFLHGQCHHSCPAGFEPDWQLVKCIPRVHCEVGEWSDWGPCLQKQGLRAYRKGQETRTRQVLQNPSVHGNTCPHLSEFRKCVFKKRQGSTL
ncbi:R-spondin-3-like [Gouania willdenowi]|uniref:R-spondin-3-like n=1 Tax=Gouania willdenowi TaxID=441366 RepID=UPI001055A6AF|nr:R-spondin-3-like [Gouania willdenowi]